MLNAAVTNRNARSWQPSTNTKTSRLQQLVAPSAVKVASRACTPLLLHDVLPDADWSLLPYSVTLEISLTATTGLMSLRVLDEAACAATDAGVVSCDYALNATNAWQTMVLSVCVPCDGLAQAELMADVRLPDDATLLRRIRLEAAPPLSTVQGEVLSMADGKVAGADVRLNGSYPAASGLGFGPETCTYDHHTTTDTNGRYVLAGVSASVRGLYAAVEVSKEGWSTASLFLEPLEASIVPEGQLAAPYLVRQVRLSDPSFLLLSDDALEVAIGSFFAAGERVVASGMPVRLDVFGGVGEAGRPPLSYSSAVGETVTISSDELLAAGLDPVAPVTLRATVVEEHMQRLSWDAAGSHLDIAPATAVARFGERVRVELLLFAALSGEGHLHAVLEWDPSSSQLPLSLSLQYTSGGHSHTVDSGDDSSTAARWVGFEPSNIVGRDFTSAPGREALTITDPTVDALFAMYAVMEERRCVGLSRSAADVPGGVDGIVDCTGDCISGANYCTAHFSQQAQATVCGRCRAFGEEGDAPLCPGAPQGLYVPTDPSFSAAKCNPAPWLNAEEKNCKRLAAQLAGARASLTLYSGATKLYEWHVQTDDPIAAAAACAGVRENSASPYAIALPRVQQLADGSARLAGLDGWVRGASPVRHTMASLLEDRSRFVGECQPYANSPIGDLYAAEAGFEFLGGSFPEVSFSGMFVAVALAFSIIFSLGFGMVAISCFCCMRVPWVALALRKDPCSKTAPGPSAAGQSEPPVALSSVEADALPSCAANGKALEAAPKSQLGRLRERVPSQVARMTTERSSSVSSTSTWDSQRLWLEGNLEKEGFPADPFPRPPPSSSAGVRSPTPYDAATLSGVGAFPRRAPSGQPADAAPEPANRLRDLREQVQAAQPALSARGSSSSESSAMDSARDWLERSMGKGTAKKDASENV